MITDDRQTLICTRAQKGEEAAIHTLHDNSIIGRYFRKRLGLPDGAFVKSEDLIRYERNGVKFYEIDDENYYMDFSV